MCKSPFPSLAKAALATSTPASSTYRNRKDSANGRAQKHMVVAGGVNLHLGLEPDFTPAKRAHPAFVVEDLDAILAACKCAAISTKPDTSFNGFRRVHVLDPFGNRLELMERTA